jgi:hypothetical protein
LSADARAALAVRPRIVPMSTAGAVPPPASAAPPPREPLSGSTHLPNETQTADPYAALRVRPRSAEEVAQDDLAQPSTSGAVVAAPLRPADTATHRIMHSNSRVKSAVKTALYGFIHGGVPGLISGGIQGALDDTTDERIGQARDLAQHQRQQVYDLGVEKERAGIEHTKAETSVLKDKAAEAQAARDAKAATAAIARVMTMHGRLGRYHPDDPADAGSQALKAQAERLGIELTPYDPKQTAPTHFMHDGVAFTLSRDADGEVHAIPLTDAQGNSLPVDASKVADPQTGMLPAQMQAHRDRVAGQTETHRHNTVTEGQGGTRIAQGAERIGIARGNQALRGQPTATATNARLARASELGRKLEEEKAKAANPPRSIKGADGSWQPTDEKYRAGYTARHKQAAAGYRDQIKNAFGDIYEVGEDGDGWAYAKPKIQPNAGVPAGAPQGGAYAGHRFSRSQLPEIRKRLGVGSDAEAERIVTEQGGVIY